MKNMMLLTKALEKKLPSFSELLKELEKLDSNSDEITAYIKFFTPFPRCMWGTICDWRWYAVAWDAETKAFYGWVDGIESEWGWFSLEEIKSIRVTGELGVERDLSFTPKKMKDIDYYVQREIHNIEKRIGEYEAGENDQPRITIE
ncbi:MAG: DUF2958 domain-containing protein [Planctomycetes bacterium]|nr:DUF2958 domain-containing protein [Planctomycetota bacterium]